MENYKEPYKELFELSPSLLLVLDSNFSIVAVTNAYLAATMTKREDIMGKNIFEVFPDNPNDKEATGVNNLRNSFNNVLQNKAPDTMAVQKYDIRKPESEGGGFEERYWSPYNSPVLDNNNEVKYIIHRVEDVTEYLRLKQKNIDQQELNENLRNLNIKMDLEIIERAKELQNTNKALTEANQQLLENTKELQRSNEELGRFAETASHDIKAPFRSVGMYLEIIKKKLELQISIDSEIDESFKRIASLRERIAALLDDLLKFARIAQSDEEFAKVDTNKILEDVLKNVEFYAKETNTNIIIKNKMPVVIGVKSQIEQLFQNIIDNAIKFQDKSKPEIIIDSHKEGKFIEFSIKDNGIGIDPQYFEKIFKVFERLNTQQKFPGTGLGLAICKRIVNRHGGKIWITSEPGKGTTFYFTLKAA